MKGCKRGQKRLLFVRKIKRIFFCGTPEKIHNETVCMHRPLNIPHLLVYVRLMGRATDRILAASYSCFALPSGRGAGAERPRAWAARPRARPGRAGPPATKRHHGSAQDA